MAEIKPIRGYFIHGKTGSGKTYFLHKFAELYSKEIYGYEKSYFEITYDLNNDYSNMKYKIPFKNQPIVVFDDLEHMKDNYVFNEMNDKIRLNPDVLFLFTSYYAPDRYKWTIDLINIYNFRVINLNLHNKDDAVICVDNLVSKIIHDLNE